MATKPGTPKRKPRRAKAQNGSARPFIPPVRFKAVVLPGAKDGEWELKSGAPEILSDWLTVREFVREARNISVSYLEHLCRIGKLRSKRKSDRPRSSYLIPRSELETFEKLRHAER